MTKTKAHTELTIKGRDIEETAFAMTLNPQLLSWNIIGEAGEIQKTQNQQIVYDCLKKLVNRSKSLK
jgi:hypothetical protein